MKKILILILSISMSCSGDDDSNTSDLNIRLSNVSPYNFQNIVINTGTGNTNFKTLILNKKQAIKPLKLPIGMHL